MSLLERMMRDQMRRQALYGRRRRPAGMWTRPRGYGWGRPSGRTNVRVGGCGCCLPIPLGVMTAGALGVRMAARRMLG